MNSVKQNLIDDFQRLQAMEAHTNMMLSDALEAPTPVISCLSPSYTQKDMNVLQSKISNFDGSDEVFFDIYLELSTKIDHQMRTYASLLQNFDNPQDHAHDLLFDR